MSGAFQDNHAPDLISWVLAPFAKRWKAKYDLIVYTDENFGLVSSLVNRLLRIKYLIVVHEGHHGSRPSVIRKLMSALYTDAAAVLTSSPITEHSLHSQTKSNVLLATLARPADSILLAKEPFILFDTRWSKFRDPWLILDIIDNEPRATYVMAGSFPTPGLERDFRNEVTKRGHGGRLRLRLNLPRHEVPSLYRRATAYVRWPEIHAGAPHERGVGWGVITALENGCPVVLDYRMGGAALIKDGVQGFLVEHHVKEYCTSISKLLRRPELVRAMAKEAWNLSKELSIESFSLPLNRLLREVERDSCNTDSTA